MIQWQALAPLRPRDRIGIVAPGGALSREAFETGLAPLRAMGLEPVYDERIFARHGYFAGDDTLREAHLFETLADSSLRGIWAARGGYGSARLLPGLDVDAVAKAGKWLVGFSDISALHCKWAQAGLPSLHAVTVNKLAAWGEAPLAALQACLMARRPLTLPGAGGARLKGSVRGRMFGGNLTVLASLAGTGFLPPWEDGIVFVEDVGESPYRLHRVATQLVQAGAFRGVRAVVVGQLTDCPPTSPDRPATPYEDVVAELAGVFAPLGLPVMWGLPVGHADTSWPLPLGHHATLDTTACALIVEPAG